MPKRYVPPVPSRRAIDPADPSSAILPYASAATPRRLRRIEWHPLASVNVGISLLCGAMVCMAVLGHTITGAGAIFAAWNASPYVCIACLAYTRRASVVSQCVLLLLIIGAGVLSVEAFKWIDKDAQGALVLVFAPLWQWVGCVVAGLVLLGIALIERRRYG